MKTKERPRGLFPNWRGDGEGPLTVKSLTMGRSNGKRDKNASI